MTRKYASRDYEMIKEWSKARGQAAPKAASLSTVGYVTDEQVAGWLYLTDSNIALIDGVISNPLSYPSKRRQALRQLCGVLVDKAHQMGYTNIVAVTKHPSIKKICKDMGFVSDDEFKIFALRE